MDLKAYLAKNYGAGNRKPKKKKPKLATAPKNAAVVRIIDETEDWKDGRGEETFETTALRVKSEINEFHVNEIEEMEGAPVVEAVKDLSWKSDNWVTVVSKEDSLQVDEEDAGRRRRVYSDDEDTADAGNSDHIHRGRVLSDDEAEYTPTSRTHRRTPTPSPPPSERVSQTKMKVTGNSDSIDENVNQVKSKTMSDGTMAGLQSLDAYSSQLEKAVVEKQISMKSSKTAGKDAQTVYRDKMGRIIDVEALEQAEIEKKQLQEKREAERSIFKYGIKQMTDAKKMRERMQDESQSFAISKDDRLRNELQKSKQRWGDPMAHLVKSKEDSSAKSGVPVRPVCPHAAPPNRYNIKPGYRWDGVDRSNGFEAKIFLARNDRSALQYEAYKWSTEDM